ncbi:MAG: chemotaxis protein CheA [Deltaproteobacteria bacterium]|nr:chemotaxis protein CheA [Deltaproteobacteria bacterium]
MQSNGHFSEELKEIIGEFILESKELIETATNDMLTFEKTKERDLINNIFRAIHTIKGTSSFLNFNNLAKLAHISEDVLGRIRKNELDPELHVINLLLQSFDTMRLILDEIETKGSDQTDLSGIVRKLEEVLSGGDGKGTSIGTEEIASSLATVEPSFGVPKIESERAEVRSEAESSKISEPEKIPGRKRPQKEEQTIRIDVKKLDDLMNLVGELVLGKNRLRILSETVKKANLDNQILDSLSDVTDYIELITNELQLSVMRARLVPISKVFNKIPRMVRELCLEFNKEVDINIEGEETELDKSVIEILHDPMVHIIRNAMDHGIEPPEERERKGKPRRGMLSVKAYKEGNHIIIEVTDDGKGIDTKALKEKVKEKKLLSEEELNSMSEKEIMNLIFLPGLSTAKTVTKVSGRGVGMDVVKTSIERLNGQVYVDSLSGHWTKLTLKLPLTIAIMKSLIIEKDEDFYAIPLNNVVELVKPKENEIKYVDKKEVFVLRDKVIPVLDLSRAFGRNGSTNGKNYLVICQVEDRMIAVKVDSVVGQEEVVIKPLGEFLGNIAGIGGATIRGDGRVILILDISSLVRLTFSQIHQKKIQLLREEVGVGTVS